MSVPLAKRQKSAEGLPPIIFKLPGMKCDTRLLVFDQEFQVHSMILKLHSAFFRKFLDSAEKQNLPPPSTSSFYPSFKYNWVTAVDGDDGEGWHLVSSNEYVSTLCSLALLLKTSRRGSLTPGSFGVCSILGALFKTTAAHWLTYSVTETS